MIGGIVRLAAGAALGLVLVAAFTVIRIWDQGERDEQRPADAIVVLGAAQYDGRPSPVFEARLEHAVALYRAGLAPVLVVTGGKAIGDRTTEAAAARDYAIGHGVPAAAILSEDVGRTTVESLVGVARLLDERGLESAVFVSDRTHLLRVLRVATDLGVTAWGSPTTTSPVDDDGTRRLEATLRELAALAAYYAGWSDPGPAEPIGPTP